MQCAFMPHKGRTIPVCLVAAAFFPQLPSQAFRGVWGGQVNAKIEDTGLKIHQKSDKAVREAYYGAKGEDYKPIDPKSGKTVASVRPTTQESSACTAPVMACLCTSSTVSVCGLM